MYQTIFVILALTSVQMVTSQTTGCVSTYYLLDSSCISRLYNGDTTVCPRSGTCGYQLYNLLDACRSSVSLTCMIATRYAYMAIAI